MHVFIRCEASYSFINFKDFFLSRYQMEEDHKINSPYPMKSMLSIAADHFLLDVGNGNILHHFFYSHLCISKPFNIPGTRFHSTRSFKDFE